jgi:hypothetical protein
MRTTTMQRSLMAAGLCLAALGLQACSQSRAGATDHGLCHDFHLLKTPAKASASAPGAAAAAAANPGSGAVAPLPGDASSTDPSAAVDDCVRRWAYSLARSSDGAQDVANAALGACSAPLASWNEQTLSQANGPAQAPSITTGEPTNPLAAHAAWAHGRALLYVVQARAGHCAPPPARNGVPEGVPS